MVFFLRPVLGGEHGAQLISDRLRCVAPHAEHFGKFVVLPDDRDCFAVDGQLGDPSGALSSAVDT